MPLHSKKHRTGHRLNWRIMVPQLPTDEGVQSALQIEPADGTQTILRFRTAALPETADGIAMW